MNDKLNERMKKPKQRDKQSMIRKYSNILKTDEKKMIKQT